MLQNQFNIFNIYEYRQSLIAYHRETAKHLIRVGEAGQLPILRVVESDRAGLFDIVDRRGIPWGVGIPQYLVNLDGCNDHGYVLNIEKVFCRLR